jgi:hypothetical protein
VIVALSSLKGLDRSSCAVPRLVDLFSFVLRRFWAAPVAASGSRIGPVGREQLRSAVLLTYNGDGHTAYHRGSNCINTAVDDYLTQSALPATGTICQPDRPATS